MQGLTVQGVSPTRLTPRPNENITVPDEVGRAIVLRNLARQLTEPRTAIVMAGLGVQPAAPTVLAAVRAESMRAVLARAVASTSAPVELSSTPTVEPRSDEVFTPGHPLHRGVLPRPGYAEDVAAYGATDDIEVELHIPGMQAIPLEGYETDKPFEVEL